MEITDSHIHLWRQHSPDRPWPDPNTPHVRSQTDFTPEDGLAAMREGGVARAIVIPPSFEGNYNDLCLAAIMAYPSKLAMMGHIDVGDPANSALLARWRSTKGVLGIRLNLAGENALRRLTAGAMDWLWPAAEAANVPIMINAPRHSAKIGQIAAKFTGLKLAIDHAGIPREHRPDEVDELVRAVAALAPLPNVGVKLSAMTSITSDQYPFPSIRPYIRHLYSEFGPQRLFWGSDLSRLPCTYRQSVTHFTEELSFLSETDLEWIMGRAIEAWLGWSPGSPG